MLTRKLKVRCNKCGHTSEGVRIVESEDAPVVLVECSAPQHSTVVNKPENAARGFGRDDVQLVEMSHGEKTFGGRDLVLPSHAIAPTAGEVEAARSAAVQTGERVRALEQGQQAALVESSGLTAEQLAALHQSNREAVAGRMANRYPAPGEL